MQEKTIQLPKMLLSFPIIIGISLILSTIIGAYTFYKVRQFDNTLSVTGSAKVAVISDQVKWSSQFSRIVYLSNLKTGYAEMTSDLTAVKKFFANNGIAEKDLNISAVSMDEIWDNNNSGAPKQYNLRQTVEINSADVEKISNLAKNIQPLINQGVVFSTMSLEYYISKLPELRISLLSDAVKDAKARADKLAESSGKKVGSLKSASSGVVQVVSANSIDVADYGMYDTSKINKEVMVSVRASFSLK